MSVSHEHFSFWFVEIGADLDQLLKLSNAFKKLGFRLGPHYLVIPSAIPPRSLGSTSPSKLNRQQSPHAQATSAPLLELCG
jgi:hypothetical protein